MRQYPSHNYRLIPNFWNSKLTHQIICYRTRECFKSAWTRCRPFRECQCEALKSDPSKRLIKPVITTWGIFVLGARLGLAAAVLQYNSQFSNPRCWLQDRLFPPQSSWRISSPKTRACLAPRSSLYLYDDLGSGLTRGLDRQGISR